MRRLWAWATRRRDALVNDDRLAAARHRYPAPLPARTAPLDPELHARIRRIVGR